MVCASMISLNLLVCEMVMKLTQGVQHRASILSLLIEFGLLIMVQKNKCVNVPLGIHSFTLLRFQWIEK